MVGVVSDGFFVAADILRRRIFADFALAHTLRFDAEVCTGELRPNPAFAPVRPSRGAPPCASNVLRGFRQDEAEPKVETIWAVGSGADDLEMLLEADRAFVIDPAVVSLARRADATRIESFDALAALVDEVTAGLPAEGA